MSNERTGGEGQRARQKRPQRRIGGVAVARALEVDERRFAVVGIMPPKATVATALPRTVTVLVAVAPLIVLVPIAGWVPKLGGGVPRLVGDR